jgi:gamma-glutamyltranspeptidase / glutathione hydrolase
MRVIIRPFCFMRQTSEDSGMTPIAHRTVLLLFVMAAFNVSAHPSGIPKNGMVVSAHVLASDAGVEILKRGGNAVDAAVAAGFALAVVYPEAGNLGGGGFMLVRMGDGRSGVIDCRETAPGASTRNMYLDSSGSPTGESLRGYRSIGVPGMVAGLLMAQERFGRLSRSDVLAPAIRLASKGFRVDGRLEASFAEYGDDLLRYPSTAKAITKDGKFYREGDLLKQPDLAATLTRIATLGMKGFYDGVTARNILREIRRGGGIITESDLREYRAVFRKPLTGTYRGYEVMSIPPPSSGGTCLIEMLNMAETFDLASAGFHSSRSVHILAEIMKRAFADRSTYLGDADFTAVPVAELTSKAYGSRLASFIDTMRATPASNVKPGNPRNEEGKNTTHYVVADSAGNVVSVTTTLNDIFGSKIIVDGSGFFLNNTMDDFSVAPGSPNFYGLIGGEANAIEARKRPLSSMTPAILVKDGMPVLALGSRGGPRIITSVFQTIVNVVDYGMSLRHAVSSPRIHHQWLPDTLYYEVFSLPVEVTSGLTKRGFVSRGIDEYLGRVQAIMIDMNDRRMIGCPDPREGGGAAGY